MSTKIRISTDKLVALANVIRTKQDLTNTFTIDEMIEIIKDSLGGAKIESSTETVNLIPKYKESCLKEYYGNLSLLTLLRNRELPSILTFKHNEAASISANNVIQCKTSLYEFFKDCDTIISLPTLDTSNITVMQNMFKNCTNLTTIPQLDTSKVTDMNTMFNNCINLKTIPELDTSNATDMRWMFVNCKSLETVEGLNLVNVTKAGDMFFNCPKLTNITLTNIKTDLELGEETYYGHLLTLDSLIGVCKECVNTGEPHTLYLSSPSKEKIIGKVFFKFKDPSVGEVAIGEKGDVELCETSITGSFTINDYMAMKNWTIA